MLVLLHIIVVFFVCYFFSLCIMNKASFTRTWIYRLVRDRRQIPLLIFSEFKQIN